MENEKTEIKKPFVLCLITARGGSIRLPRKNIKSFCNHPLVAWSIMQGLCARQVDLTVLTTDDAEIAAIGLQYGAKVVRRPVWDNDTTAGVPFAHAVHELGKEGIFPDEIISMLPTSPLKKPNDLDDLISAFHLVNKYCPSDEMGTYSPDRENFVYKNMDDMTCSYGKPYHVLPVITDKLWQYSKLCGGWGIAKKDWVMNVWETQPKFDSVIDNNLEGAIPPKKLILAYAVEPWQCFETDYDHY